MNRTLLIALSLLLFSCEDMGDLFRSYGPETTELRRVGSFSRITAGEKFDVVLVQDSTRDGEVEITAGKNVIEGYTTEVTNGELRIANDNKFNWVRKLKVRQKVVVYFRELKDIQIHGSAKFSCRDSIISSSEFRISHGGLEDAVLKIRGDYIFFDGTNTGGAYISGSCYLLSASADDISFINCLDLDAEKCYISSFSRENSFVNGRNVIEVKLYGTGNIYYKREPALNFNVEDKGEGEVLRY